MSYNYLNQPISNPMMTLGLINTTQYEVPPMNNLDTTTISNSPNSWMEFEDGGIIDPRHAHFPASYTMNFQTQPTMGQLNHNIHNQNWAPRNEVSYCSAMEQNFQVPFEYPTMVMEHSMNQNMNNNMVHLPSYPSQVSNQTVTYPPMMNDMTVSHQASGLPSPANNGQGNNGSGPLIFSHDLRGRAENWNHEETKTFLAIIEAHSYEFQNIRRYPSLWKTIQSTMLERGYNRSIEKCKNRWKVLVAKYKKCHKECMRIKDNATEQGKANKEIQAVINSFEFFETIQRLLYPNYAFGPKGIMRKFKTGAKANSALFVENQIEQFRLEGYDALSKLFFP